MEYQNYDSKSFMAIIRHGERADRSEDGNLNSNNNFNPFDPCLTKLGLKQASTTAKYIKDICNNGLCEDKYQFTKIIIACSPFLRCIQTAAVIAEHIGVDEVQIN
mmetsp:Transcript_7302/g.6389  ORF Transcript_7302/g.6389 Transcript_7302/m.6389 type:complete len:105 (-) Transcript_7302:624-938(-)